MAADVAKQKCNILARDSVWIIIKLFFLVLGTYSFSTRSTSNFQEG